MPIGIGLLDQIPALIVGIKVDQLAGRTSIQRHRGHQAAIIIRIGRDHAGLINRANLVPQAIVNRRRLMAWNADAQLRIRRHDQPVGRIIGIRVGVSVGVDHGDLVAVGVILILGDVGPTCRGNGGARVRQIISISVIDEHIGPPPVRIVIILCDRPIGRDGILDPAVQVIGCARERHHGPGGVGYHLIYCGRKAAAHQQPRIQFLG